jgi:tetratricopeptide (TPR) repeat protein
MSSQQQTQADRFLNFLGWVEANKKQLIQWGIGIVVVVGAVIAFFNYQLQKEKRASEALSNVRAPLSPATPIAPGTADAYLKVAKDFAGTKAAGRALLMAASTKFIEGDYAGSQKLFEQFIREYGDSPWLAQAYYGIAADLDAQHKTAEATTKYEEVRRRFATDPIADQTKLALARLYEQQSKPAEALKLYDELTGPNAVSGFGSEAQVRREELLDKHPELKTNLPPALSANMLQQLTNQLLRSAATNAQKSMATNRAIVTNITSAPVKAPVANPPAPEKAVPQTNK